MCLDPVHDPEIHNPEWTPSRMDTISYGHHPEWTQITNGHHPEWIPSRMDAIPNEHNPECTPSRMDTFPNGHNPTLVLYSYCLVRSLLRRRGFKQKFIL